MLITGTASGIGASLTVRAAQAGYFVYAGVRKNADIAKVAAAAAAAGVASSVAHVQLDVTDDASIAAAVSAVRASLGGDNGRLLAALVNNAGAAVVAPLLSHTRADLAALLDVNLGGPIVLVKAAAGPLLGINTTTPAALLAPPTRRATRASLDPNPLPRILNVSSVEGRTAALPFTGAYAASKHALEAASDALRRELAPWGVDVLTLAPGATRTPLASKLAAPATPGPWGAAVAACNAVARAEIEAGLDPAAVADAALRLLAAPAPPAKSAITARPFPHWYLPLMLPDRLGDDLTCAMVGLTPGAVFGGDAGAAAAAHTRAAGLWPRARAAVAGSMAAAALASLESEQKVKKEEGKKKE